MVFLPKPGDAHVLDLFSLKGQVAVVTGGNRGIGLEVVKALAEAGASVAIIYRSSSSAHEIASQLSSQHGTTIRAYQCDVSDESAVDKVFDEVVKDFSKIDILVANAGICYNVAAEDMTTQQFRSEMGVNFDGPWFCARSASRYFKKQGSGNVIFTTSISGMIVNIPDKQAIYNASKAGLIHLVKSLAIEWIDFARVNCVSPGYIATDMLMAEPQELRDKWVALTPAKRMGETYELKGAFLFCASNASSFMTGANIVVDGAYTIP
ncbi:oxidoreductase [Exophiala viscosa]|uniref:Oxidoreductase n=1 Tax=Exophiala viscosa TaxID=2486360 RepID=A0AAN6DS26_9EURO|nr:oxidoreductase [Exophiala viscosa]KAI1624772.1 oxidoreductase [Exophiala viscosa]